LTIRLGDFQGFEICDSMASELESKNPEKVILDLRSNPGGYLFMANCINGLFLGNDLPVVQTAEAEVVNDNQTPKPAVAFSSESKKYTYKGPLVVLVDSNSASASEVVSGALKDYGRAVIVGERTFGKGSAQDTVSAGHYFPKVELRKTSNYWVSPSGYSVHALGVTPDITVLLTPFSKDERNGGSYEETVSWMGVKAFEKPILKNVTPIIDTSVKSNSFNECRTAQPKQFASMDEMIKAVKGDYQFDLALQVSNCLKKAGFYWQMPRSNRLDVFNNVYGRKVEVQTFDPIMESLRDQLKKASGQ